jgi:predicted lipoprotein with Yx(FWY)xxD motif
MAVTGAVQAAARSQPPPTTPAGVTLVEVVRHAYASPAQYLWTRPGDAEGRTLLAFDQDTAAVSKCTSDCAKEFPPLLANHGARAFGDWSLVRRGGGQLQWAYQTHPLYTWSKEQEAGDIAMHVAVTEATADKLLEPGQASVDDTRHDWGPLPPKGWQVVRFEPAATLSLPDGIDARLVPTAQAVVLTNASGLTLYAFSGRVDRDGQGCTSSHCTFDWRPLAAPSLASNVGNFTIITRGDGSTQWAYKDKALYTFKGDKYPGDVNGDGVDGRWELTALAVNFQPKGVALHTVSGYGPVFSANGASLYSAHPYERRFGGRDLVGNYRNDFQKGIEFAAQGCESAKCLATWHPFLADARAESSGFWQLMPRKDGTRQWMYMGFPVYTYANDHQPGEVNGNAIFDFRSVGEDAEPASKVLFIEKFDAKVPGDGGPLAAVYWHLVEP